jgi:hypothetical protein
MDEIEVRPQEISEAREGSERAEAQRLDDATFEPRAYAEQSGDYRQAEAIQSNFTAVIEQVRDCPTPIPHTGSELSGGTEQVGVTPLPIPRPDDGSGDTDMAVARDDSLAGQEPKIYAGPYEKAPGGDNGGENVTPINLPNVRDEVGRIAIDPLPVPRTGSELSGGTEQVGVTPLPIPRPDEGSGGISIAIARDDSLAGQQPKVATGPYEKGPSGDDGGEDITPINLPNVRDEGLASGAQGKVSGESGTPGRIDQFTGQVIPPTGPGGSQSDETGSEGNSSIDMREASGSQDASHVVEGTGQKAPVQMERPEGGGDETRVPTGTRVTDTPPRVERPEGGAGETQVPTGTRVTDTPQQPGGRAEGSNAPLGPQELANRHFADQALNAIGMGPQGAIGNTPSGTEGTAHGYGPGAPGQGMPGGPDTSGTGTGDKFFGDSHSSGGGAPVHGYGPGTKGDDTYFKYGGTDGDGNVVGGEGSTGQNCGDTAQNMSDVAQMYGGEGGGYVSCGNGGGLTLTWGPDGAGNTRVSMTYTKGNTIDGGSPMPYTGSGHWGSEQPRDPGTIGGGTEEIRESGHFAPVVTSDGRSGGGGGGGNAGDEPSIWDDGHWYGGLWGSAGGHRTIDPGDPDYYTPDKLDNARANARAKG